MPDDAKHWIEVCILYFFHKISPWLQSIQNYLNVMISRGCHIVWGRLETPVFRISKTRSIRHRILIDNTFKTTPAPDGVTTPISIFESTRIQKNSENMQTGKPPPLFVLRRKMLWGQQLSLCLYVTTCWQRVDSLYSLKHFVLICGKQNF